MKHKNYLKRKPIKYLFALLLIVIIGVGLYHNNKPMPKMLDLTSPEYQIDANQIDFLHDLSYRGPNNKLTHDQEIFDRVIAGIARAENYILVDMFLFNPWLGKATSSYRNLSEELTDALVAQKTKFPQLKIDLITDPINIIYKGSSSWELERLQAAGVNVIITDLKPLRDSNPLYSSIWRTGLQWVGKINWPRWLKHPFSSTESKVSLGSYLNLLNFKANHRKVFLADSDIGNTVIIMSANPHDSSSAHSNVAVEIRDSDVWKSLYKSEAAVAAVSSAHLQDFLAPENRRKLSSTTLSLKLVTENAIKKTLLAVIDTAEAGDTVDMAMFYLSDRDIIESLLTASQRGAAVRIVLDPNKDAFGYTKNGIPNREAANELVERSKEKIKIRWYATNGEQFHSKLTFVRHKDIDSIILGSANLTRRNLENYNLETDVSITAASSSDLSVSIKNYFEMIWNNPDGKIFTLDFNAYKDSSRFKYLIYRLQEAMGLSSF